MHLGGRPEVMDLLYVEGRREAGLNNLKGRRSFKQLSMQFALLRL
jgi:hypothetical protein